MDRASSPHFLQSVQKTFCNDKFWLDFHSELSNFDPDLLFFPQRRFEFTYTDSKTRIEIVVPHLADTVGSTVWDAEVFLAHYIDKFLTLADNSIVVELGAGTAIAG